MDNTEKKLIELVNEFNEEIKKDLINKGINDTKKAYNSIRTELDKENQKVQSIGVDYIEILNYGRSPGSFPPKQNIQEWVRSKLGITDEKQNKGVAFLISRKIAQKGTNIFLNKSKGVEVEKKIIDLRKKIKDQLGESVKADALIVLDKFNKERLEKNGSKIN